MRGRQSGFLKAADQSPTDIEVWQRSATHEIYKAFGLNVQIDGRQRVGVDVECDFLERHNATRAHCLCGPADHYYGIALMDQDVATDGGVEWRALRQRIVRSRHKVDLPISSGVRAGTRRLNGQRFSIECNDVAGFADCLRQEHGYVSDA